MNKQYYFVVLQLPAFRQVNADCAASPGFLKKAIDAIRRGRARIISRRADTGVCEELREHALKGKRFHNYLLLQMHLGQEECDDVIILNKAAQSIPLYGATTVVDCADRYCLMAV